MYHGVFVYLTEDNWEHYEPRGGVALVDEAARVSFANERPFSNLLHLRLSPALFSTIKARFNSLNTKNTM